MLKSLFVMKEIYISNKFKYFSKKKYTRKGNSIEQEIQIVLRKNKK